MNSTYELILSHFMFALGMVSGVVGLCTGTLLILRPDWLARLGELANRWVSTRKFDSALERSISLDKWFYQHNRLSGGMLLAGALWLIVFFLTSFDKPRLLAAMTKLISIPPALADALLDALVLASLTGAVFALLVSLFLLFRPSLMREFEQSANLWLSSRKALKPLELPRSGVDRYVLEHYRVAGFLLLLGSLYLLGMLTFWLG